MAYDLFFRSRTARAAGDQRTATELASEAVDLIKQQIENAPPGRERALLLEAASQAAVEQARYESAISLLGRARTEINSLEDEGLRKWLVRQRLRAFFLEGLPGGWSVDWVQQQGEEENDLEITDGIRTARIVFSRNAAATIDLGAGVPWELNLVTPATAQGARDAAGHLALWAAPARSASMESAAYAEEMLALEWWR